MAGDLCWQAARRESLGTRAACGEVVLSRTSRAEAVRPRGEVARPCVRHAGKRYGHTQHVGRRYGHVGRWCSRACGMLGSGTVTWGGGTATRRTPGSGTVAHVAGGSGTVTRGVSEWGWGQRVGSRGGLEGLLAECGAPRELGAVWRWKVTVFRSCVFKRGRETRGVCAFYSRKGRPWGSQRNDLAFAGYITRFCHGSLGFGGRGGYLPSCHLARAGLRRPRERRSHPCPLSVAGEGGGCAFLQELVGSFNTTAKFGVCSHFRIHVEREMRAQSP